MLSGQTKFPAGKPAPATALLLTSLLMTLFLAVAPAGAWPVNTQIHLLEVDGAISPASAEFITRNLATAAEAQAELVVLRMDTPGGLDKSMRQIIKAILASPVPVATWVAPAGSRAASAGTYILYASHIAAMAPSTNLGAATPVNIGGAPTPATGKPETGPGNEREDAGSTLERKAVNDAVAYIQGLADLRGRNRDWAEQAVRQAASLTARDALANKVIDLVAGDLDTLLAAVDGRSLTLANENGPPRTVTLATANAQVLRITPDWRTRVLAVLTDPNIAYILLMIGIYGLVLEFYNPGTGPGIIGVICLLLGMYALQMLPVSWVGLALLAVGLGLMLTEAVNPGFGVFGAGGVVAFVLGSVLLFDSDIPGYGVSWGLIAAFTLSSVLVLGFLVAMALRTRKAVVTTGVESMVGAHAEALIDFANGTGRVRAFGEIWQARSSGPVQAGMDLRVTAVDGLVLDVVATPPG